MALHCNIKKSPLFTVHIVDNKITCIRCNITGKFVSIKKYLAKQKANVILTNAQANKPNNYLSIAIMLVFVIVAYALCFNTIKERQQQYDSVNSNELMLHYYDSCNTDSECEQLEAKLNFDFKKGINWLWNN